MAEQLNVKVNPVLKEGEPLGPQMDSFCSKALTITSRDVGFLVEWRHDAIKMIRELGAVIVDRDRRLQDAKCGEYDAKNEAGRFERMFEASQEELKNVKARYEEDELIYRRTSDQNSTLARDLAAARAKIAELETTRPVPSDERDVNGRPWREVAEALRCDLMKAHGENRELDQELGEHKFAIELLTSTLVRVTKGLY